ncbi:junction-mediating and -regulatory protein-like [Grus japonensis]|uniref:Junction-mediating and -regulatory protein-like n=1 Tax=Grus japonensis TaxID=30415 RepID=A0ABC9VZI7_GRUJA
MPAGSQMDLLLAKAKPISNGGSASGVTEIRRRKNCCAFPVQPMEIHSGADICLQPMEDPTLEQSVPEGLHPMEGTHAGAGAECEESSPEEEGAAETVCDELTTTPIPHPSVPLEVGREFRSDVKRRKKGRDGRKVF